MPSERSIGSASSYPRPVPPQSGYDRAQQNRANNTKAAQVARQQGYDRAQQNRAQNAQAAARQALIDRQAGYDQAQVNRAESAQVDTPVYSWQAPVNYSGSGRNRGYDSGGGGGGYGAAASFAAPVTSVASSVQAQPAAVAPPPPVFTGAGSQNVAGESFETVSGGQGTFGQEQRRRQARGPRTGLSLTPEMLQRAAMKRLG